jgi:two-component system capsular synthesis response regulator RcsB
VLRIILADDHPVVRKGVRAVLETDPGMTVVAEADAPAQLLAVLRQVACDVVITDFGMPSADNADGLVLLRRLQQEWPGVFIIVLTLLENPGVLRSILALGIPGLVNKADSLHELSLCIGAVMSGRHPYLSSSIRGNLERQQTGRWTDDPAQLSPRELEVLRHFAAGMSISEIAERTGRSRKTISRQKRCAMEKLGLESDKDIFHYAQASGLS